MYIWNIISISWRLHVSEFCVSQVSHALYLPDLMLQLDCLSLHWYHEQCPTLLSQREAKAKARFKYLILVLQVHLKTEFSNIFWSSLIFRRPHHAPFRLLRDQRDGNSKKITSTFAPSTLHAFCVASYGRLLKARESCETDVLGLASSIFRRWCWKKTSKCSYLFLDGG